MVQQLKPFQEKDFSASGAYDAEFSGLPISKIGLRFGGTLTGSAATFRTDAAFRLLGTPEINQAENPLIRMAGSSWRLLSAILAGAFDVHTASATLAHAQAMIDLQAIMPNAMINGADKKVFLRGTFGALADFSGTAPTGCTGKVRAFIESSELDPTKGFLRPRFTESTLALQDSDTNPHTFKFEQDTVAAFLMIQAWDNSAIDRVDTLIKRLRIDHVGPRGNIELHRMTWGQARTWLGKRFTPEDQARAAGCVCIPLIDRSNPQFNNAVLFRAGDSLTINYDCQAAIEEEFVTAQTAAANDVARATVIGFTPVAGTGDTAAQVRTISAAPSSVQVVALSSRERRRLARAQRRGAE